jgi:seryl-tRNA synthetase
MFGGGLHTAVVLGGFLVAWGMVLAVGFLIWKTGSARVWKDNAEGQKERADELQRKLDEMLSEHKEALKTIGNLKAINERLEALPNLQKIIEWMAQEREKADKVWTERTSLVADRIVTGIQDEIDRHEEEAKERHLEVMRQLRGEAA